MGELTPAQEGARGTGRWTRAGIAAQVLALVLLAAGAASLVTWLTGRPGLHRRLDLTATGRNTLDPVLAGILASLPETATVEVFFRPLPGPWRAAGDEAQGRMSELLFVAHNQFPARLDVIQQDLSNVAAAAQRLAELDVQEDNVVVVSCGERRVILRLLRDIARLDPGNPAANIAPRMESFLGDQALGEALLDVSQGERPKVLFAAGHGERDPVSTDPGGLNLLRAALEADGFDVGVWEPAVPAQVPADCDVLALVDPRQVYSPEEVSAVREFVLGGGRLFVAPNRSDAVLRESGGTREILQAFGVSVSDGVVAQPKPDVFGNFVDGLRECAMLFVPSELLSSRHPVTEPLQRVGYRLRNFPASRAFVSSTPPPNGRVEALVQSTQETWRDLPDVQGEYNWHFEAEREQRASHVLVMAAEFPPQGLEPQASDPEGPPTARPRARVLAFGSVEGLANDTLVHSRDLVLNAFNWLAERDWRLTVRPRDPDRRSLDLNNTAALAAVNRVAFFGLPGLFALTGVLLAFLRRR